MKTLRWIPCAVAVLCLFSLDRQNVAYGGEDDPDRTTIYFLRHAEDIEESVLADAFEPVCVDSCCLEVLNDIGVKRAELLAAWFKERMILPRLTHIIASHKIRTWQTVAPIATAAVAEGAVLAEDDDLHPDDGVQQVPELAEECSPGFEGAGSSRVPMTELLQALPLGSEAVVAGHSGTLYPIMEELGVDTSDPVDFPKNSRGRVAGFGNIWIIQVDANGQGRLKRHLVLEFELARLNSRD